MSGFKAMNSLPSDHAKAMTNLTIRLDFDSGESLGPGKVRLLEAVSETGSIRRAAKLCGMSFRQAWLLLQAVEEMFGTPLTETVRGGVRGGGTRLTPLGVRVASSYRKLEQAAAEAAKPESSFLAASIRSREASRSGKSEKTRLTRKSLRK
jgi:molybdate transport system regulatory protein